MLCLALLMIAANVFSLMPMQVFAQDNDASAVTDTTQLASGNKVEPEDTAENADQAVDAPHSEEGNTEKPAPQNHSEESNSKIVLLLHRDNFTHLK